MTGLLPAPARAAAAEGPLRRAARALRRHTPTLAAAALVLALWLATLWAATQLGQLCTGFSLRYNAPLSGQAATAARHYAAENPEDAPWPTFWRQDTAEIKSKLFSTKAPCLSYSGEGDLVWPARFLGGGWPGAVDEAGCAVSEGLAHALWGSADVVGKTLEMGDKTYTVRGVFAGKTPLCLARVSDGSKAGWQAAELRPDAGMTRTDAEDFAQKSGFGAPDAVLSPDLPDLAAILCWLLPLACVGIWAGRRFARWGRARRVPSRLLGLAGALGLALLLPTLLGLLPPWMIPSRWSDFAFWGTLADTLGARFDELLSLRAALRDVAVKKALLAAVCAGAAGLLPALWLGWRCAAPQKSAGRTHLLPGPAPRPRNKWLASRQ